MGRGRKRMRGSNEWRQKLDALFPESRIPLSRIILEEAQWVADCFKEGFLFKLAHDDLEEILEGGGFQNWKEKYGELVWLLMEGNMGGTLGFLVKGGLIADIRQADTKARKWAYAFNRVVRMYDTFSRAAFSKPVARLVQEAKAGNDSSLFKLMQIDKGILSSSWGAARICEAQLTDDRGFFTGLSEALKKPSFSFHQKRQIPLALFLYRNWSDLQLLRDEEIADLLEETRLWSFDDATSLRRFISRLGLKKAKPKPQSDERVHDTSLSQEERLEKLRKEYREHMEKERRHEGSDIKK